MDSINEIDEKIWKDLIERMKHLGYESIKVGFSGGNDEGYCDSITAKIGEGHKTLKKGTMLGDGYYKNTEGMYVKLKNEDILLADFKLLTGTDDYDNDNSENNPFLESPEDPGLVNLFAQQVYAEYGGFATESSVQGYVEVDAIKGTVIFDDNWQDWVNKQTPILTEG